MGEIRLFEDNGCTGNHKGHTAVRRRRINFKKNKHFTNDDARSMRLTDVPAGVVIRVYDSPDGKESDDWAEIHIKTFVKEYCFNTFEQNFENDQIRMVYHPNNGLDGKVSRLEVDI